jgi:recombination protein RecR
MSSYTQSIQSLMNELARLPGIGMRSAERIAFHLLKQSPDEAMKLADAIRDVKTRIKHCSICYNLTEQDPDLTIDALAKRLEGGGVREVIMGTNPTVDGDGTALYIQNMIATRFGHIQITRLARGLPAGSSIEYANKNILADAIAGRQKM